jgi:lipoprotein NlpI
MRWDRARAEYYVDRVADAISDLTEAVRLAPKNPYGVLWLHLSHKRAGQDDRDELELNASKLNQSSWPWPLVGFYTGNDTLESVREKSEGSEDERQRRGQVCETNFYVGVDRLNSNLATEGRQLLQSAARDCPGDFFERTAAQMELRRLEQSNDKPAQANR